MSPKAPAPDSKKDAPPEGAPDDAAVATDAAPETTPAAPAAPTLWDRVLQLEGVVIGFFRSRVFTPVPVITTIFCLCVLLGLGTWQIMRHNEKNILLSSIRDHMVAPPLDARLKPPLGDATWKSLDYKPVMLQGVWGHVQQIKIAPRTFEGAVGYHLLVPLVLRDGQIVMVNRGFVPEGQALFPPDPEKVFAVQGVARIPETLKPRGFHDNEPSRGVWTWADLAAMRHELGVNSLAPVIVYEARETGRESHPIGGVVPLPSHNRHREYALTWFALATTLLGVFMIYSAPKPEKVKQTDEQLAANDDDKMKDPVARRGLYPEATD
jgi:surfeit locus 1 family protein